MIRFIRIGNQISLIDDKGWHDFAWFNTITDTFMEFNGEQVWNSWDSFAEDYSEDIPQNEEVYSLERFKGLFQEDF